MPTDYTPIYSKTTEESLAEEFKDVLKDKIYLDHAGATLYSQKQIADVHAELTRNLFGNPHSKSIVSKTTEDSIDSVRYQILDFFGTTPQEYSVIFTSGATAALKLVAEYFDYQNGRLVYLEENHTSVLGMRTCAPRHSPLSVKAAFRLFDSPDKRNGIINGNGVGSDSDCERINSPPNSNNLFVYPAQCNFSGSKYPLEWIEKTRNGYLSNENSGVDGNLNGNCETAENWFCLLDTASFVGTNPLNLSEHKPDFVCVSFYKIFGYPTGLGALLVKNGSADVLKKKYFGGGTVFMALANQDVVVHRSNLQEKFEDGTISFLSIPSLKHGFAILKRHNLQMSTISTHVFHLGQYLYRKLQSCKHYNNQSVCVFYHDGDFTKIQRQGGIVNFNIRRADGTYIGFAEVMHVANLYNISLRTGCFCNPGACQRHLGMTSQEVRYYFEMGHVCGDQRDLIDGKPTGSVRVSFGYMSRKSDADAILDMVQSCFVQTAPQIIEDSHLGAETNAKIKLPHLDETQTALGDLQKIYIYPIKSCGTYEITHNWRLVSTGLQYDREWMIVNQDGVCLTQKHDTRMCMIRPEVNLKTKQLILTFGTDNINNNHYGNYGRVAVDLEAKFVSYQCHSKVCGDKIEGWDCGDEVAEWLDDVLGRDGLRLVKHVDRNVRKKEVKLSLVNTAQFLLINTASVRWLFDRVPNGEEKEALERSIARFRPNLLIDFRDAFVENDFREIYVGNVKLAVQGKCTRCQMICIDQATGEKTVEPLRTLSRELHGKITFGIYLRMCADDDRQGGWASAALAPTMETVAVKRDAHDASI